MIVTLGNDSMASLHHIRRRGAAASSLPGVFVDKAFRRTAGSSTRKVAQKVIEEAGEVALAAVKRQIDRR